MFMVKIKPPHPPSTGNLRMKKYGGLRPTKEEGSGAEMNMGACKMNG